MDYSPFLIQCYSLVSNLSGQNLTLLQEKKRRVSKNSSFLDIKINKT